MSTNYTQIKKIKCKAGHDTGYTENSASEEKKIGGWTFWKKPEWMKKKN